MSSTSVAGGTGSTNHHQHYQHTTTNYTHYQTTNYNQSNINIVAQDLINSIECCGIDRDGYTNRHPNTISLCDVQLIGQVVEDWNDDDNKEDVGEGLDGEDNKEDMQATKASSSKASPSSGNIASPTTTTKTTGVVWACRYILASRSIVLHRMLYNGSFRRETNSQSIALLRYPILILKTIIYYCSYNAMNPQFPTNIEHLELQLLLLQAADYLQLIEFCTLITQTILMRHLSIYPSQSVCTIYEYSIIPSSCILRSPPTTTTTTTTSGSGNNVNSAISNNSSTTGSSCSATKLESYPTTTSTPSPKHPLSSMEFLFTIAQQMIETRPYITLDPNNTYAAFRNISSSSMSMSMSHNHCYDSKQKNCNDHTQKEGNENCFDRILGLSDHDDDGSDHDSGSGGGITQFSLEKVQQLFSPISKSNIGASELFLLHQLLRWYRYQICQLHKTKPEQLVIVCTTSSDNDNNTCRNTDIVLQQEMELLTMHTKHIIDTSIELSHIEPSDLLQFITLSSSTAAVTTKCDDFISNLLSPEKIYHTISQQAIRASHTKSWSLPNYNGIRTITTVVHQQQQQSSSSGSTESFNTTTTTITLPERVLIEGSGHHDVDGMYYRINTNTSSSGSGTSTSAGLSIRSSSSTISRTSRGRGNPYQNNSSANYNASLDKNVLYTKREIMVGQQNVYTLSRCLRYRQKNIVAQEPHPSPPQQSTIAQGGADVEEKVLSDVIRTKCLIGSVGIDTNVQNINVGGEVAVETGEEDDVDKVEAYYECRIFSSPFLTYRAVRQLQLMQITSTIVPCYQPVMQLLDWSPPANGTGGSYSPPTSININNSSISMLCPTNLEYNQNRFGTFSSNDRSNSMSPTNSSTNLVVPTPIRKYYRIRLSDGEYHMPGTIAPELNGLIQRKELDVNRVIQILEFGVYTIYGCPSVHVLKAVVVTGSNTTPIHVFGNPSPLEEANPIDINNIPEDISSKCSPSTYGRLQNLYRAEVVVHDENDGHQHDYTTATMTSNGNSPKVASSSFYASGCIPRTGWQVDGHGIEPAPECTWIPQSTSQTSSSTASLPLDTLSNVKIQVEF